MLRIDQRNFIRTLSWASLSVGALAVAPRANAAPIFIPGILTLQDLIATGSTGVTIGDKKFYNFAYSPAPLGGPSPAPTASQISVLQPDAATEGIRFTYAWSSTNGNTQDSLISYDVHVSDTFPQDFLGTVGLDFNATAQGGLTDNASVSEKIKTLDQTSTYGNPKVIEFGPGSPSNIDSASFTLPAGIRDIHLTKDIQVHSGAANFQPGSSSIAYVDNTFVSAPEPASLGLLTVGSLLILRRRKMR